jgi:hypothetical protein
MEFSFALDATSAAWFRSSGYSSILAEKQGNPGVFLRLPERCRDLKSERSSADSSLQKLEKAGVDREVHATAGREAGATNS